MAGIKVTDLPVLGAAAADDVFYIVDTSTNTSKQIEVNDILAFAELPSYFTATNLDENGNGTITALKNRLGGTISFVNNAAFSYTLTRTGGAALTGTVKAYLSSLTEDSSQAVVACIGSGIGFGDTFDLVNYDGLPLSSISIVKNALLTIIYIP